VHAYQGIAFRTAYVIARDAADAEESAQDGFVKAWRALGRFREGSPFRPWLLHIVANEARNRRRSAGRRAHLVLRAAAEESSGGAAPSPEAALLSAEQRAGLLAAVEQLPEEQRTVISLRYFVGLSEHEVGEALDACEMLVASGLDVNVDLIYGLPGQSHESFLADLTTRFARPPADPRGGWRPAPCDLAPTTRI